MIRGDAVIGYVRVSTADQGRSGYGLADQRAAIEAECRTRGLRLLRIEQDTASGATTRRRPGLERCVTACERGQVQGMIASKLDRVSRSVIDFASLLARAQKGEWNVIVLDLGADLASPMGEALANMAATFAQLERRLISERTKAALAVAKKNGVRLGAPVVMTAATRRKVRRLRDRGMSYQGVADRLNAAGVRTDGGNLFYPTSVRRACL